MCLHQKRHPFFWRLLHLVKLFAAFCGLDEQPFHLCSIFRRERIAKTLELGCKSIDLGKQGIVVEQEQQLCPHRFVDLSDPRQIAERVAGVFHQMGIVMRIHERDGDDVRQLGEKADHLIMLLHAEDSDMMEVQDLGQLPRCAHRFLAVAFCRDDDVWALRNIEYWRIRCRSSPAIGCAAMNSTSSLEHLLDTVSDIDLDPADITQQGAGAESVLMRADPVDHDVRIQAEDHDVCLGEQGFRIDRPFIDQPVRQRMIDGLLPSGHAVYGTAGFFSPMA